jgi:hypothetical protein
MKTMKKAPNVRGPSDIAKAVFVIAEGMKGEPLDEEIADLVTDAIWDAFVAGKEAAQRAPAARAADAKEGTP